MLHSTNLASLSFSPVGNSFIILNILSPENSGNGTSVSGSGNSKHPELNPHKSLIQLLKTCIITKGQFLFSYTTIYLGKCLLTFPNCCT